MKSAIAVAAFTLSAILLTGCSSAPKHDPDYAPARPIAPPPMPQGNGAIYQSGFQVLWFEDMRARRVGDLLTIKLVERTDATKTATTEITRSNNASVTNPTILGVSPEISLPGMLPLSATKNLGLSTSLSSSTDFTGEGDSAQSNKLTGEITVTVTEVLANGYLMVRGEKRIGINQGNEYIKLSGIVRPADIDATNTVLSTKMADPTIVYVGDGQIAAANTMGWLAKFFISALFPF